ncbi:non-intrinsic ABC protein 8 [Actinidia rufa]|uniref:Non-intrinsic ABC protein 8 n=1 Tax=Actinidia rufa TaxID=165716 RepID=A0A7J0GWQ2_9ERIC|nr:non-intrinsic ABC protein 8 [Actinidia rufa]
MHPVHSIPCTRATSGATYDHSVCFSWRSTVPVFKAHGMAQASIADCVNETFSAIRTVQGLVNTFGDLRGAFAATERINSVLSGAEIDEALAYGLERDIKSQEVHDKNFGLFINGYDINTQSLNMHYMSALKSTSSLKSLAWSGDVCLEGVYFSYPLRPDVEILSGLNLTLKWGRVTALVGPSGAGKSTIVQLLARFYEEPVLFSLSVGENIAYGLPDDYVSKEDVIKAAKAANAHDFIISLPQGYDTHVGERGGLLSGGQRQVQHYLLVFGFLYVGTVLYAWMRLVTMPDWAGDSCQMKKWQPYPCVGPHGSSRPQLSSRLLMFYCRQRVLWMQLVSVWSRML